MGNITTILIGREANGKGAIKVPSSCSMVGRNHAKLNMDFDNGTVTLEEVDAKNGTYVNGRRIARSRALNLSDEVWLGEVGPLGYHLDVAPFVKGVRTDYSEEFKNVIAAYEEYSAELKDIQSDRWKKTALPRGIVSLLVALAGLVCFICFEDMGIRIGVISGGSVILGALNIIPWGKNDNTQVKTANLQTKYLDRYCCPKCGTKFNLNNHWTVIQKSGCPNPKCKAKFM